MNNSLGFPGIFRGVLNVAAATITVEMCIAAAEELARCAEHKVISAERILPSMDDWKVVPSEAAAVGLKAIEQGVARKMLSRDVLIEKATKLIGPAQRPRR